MVKHNGTMYHLSDSEEVNVYDVRYHCTSSENMVPYVLFYTKDDLSLTDIPLIVETPYLTSSDQMASVRNETNARLEKRAFEVTLEGFDEDDSNINKKQMLEENPDASKEIQR